MNKSIAAIEAERSILGAVLINPELMPELEQQVSEGDFTMIVHRRLLQIMRTVSSEGRIVDVVNVTQTILDRNLGNDVPVSYVFEISDGMPRRLRIDDYAAEIRAKAVLRQAAIVGEDLLKRATEQGEAGEDLIAEMDQRLLEIASRSDNQAVNLEQQSRAEIDTLTQQMRGHHVQAYPTGLAPLDLMIGGLGIGELTVLGGRPGQGKSSLIAQAVVANCQRGNACHTFSLEMASGQFLRRLWSAISGVPYRRIRRAEHLSAKEHAVVVEAAAAVSQWPLIIDDRSNITVAQIEARARLSRRRNGTKVVLIDYLQKLRFTRDLRYRHLDVTDAAVTLARMAKQEQLSVLLLSSLTEHGGTIPSLQDFRQSGDIQFEAHNALVIHREVDPVSQQLRPDGKLIVLKARADRQGAIDVRFNTDSLMFESMTAETHARTY